MVSSAVGIVTVVLNPVDLSTVVSAAVIEKVGSKRGVLQLVGVNEAVFVKVTALFEVRTAREFARRQRVGFVVKYGPVCVAPERGNRSIEIFEIVIAKRQAEHLDRVRKGRNPEREAVAGGGSWARFGQARLSCR